MITGARFVLTPADLEQFVETYLTTGRASHAAVAARYAKSRARQTGYELLQRPDVQAAIAKREAELAAAYRLRTHEIFRELGAVLRSNVDHYRVSKTGELTLAEDAPEDAMRAVASVKTTVQGTKRTTEFRLWDKNAAIEKAMKHAGLLTERHEHSGPGGVPIACAVTVTFVRPPERADG